MADDTNVSEAGSDFEWQKIVSTRKRHQHESPKLYLNKRKQVQNDNKPSTSNRFAMIQNDDDDVNNDDDDQEVAETTTNIPKPPPIYIPDVIDIKKMISNISTIITKDQFTYKSLKNNQVRLMVKTVELYRKLIKHLDAHKIGFHTYQLKQERSFRVVIKGLHHSTPVVDIKAELLALGHQVRSVTNVRSRLTKKPLPMFYVDLDPNPNNKEIYNIKHINYAIITVEAPKKTMNLIQCHRCQLFGHTKAYCKRPFNCVKCGLNHPTADCNKNADTPPRCYHCLRDHTANYKGCQVYKDILQKRLHQGYKFPNHRQQNNVHPDEFPQINSNNAFSKSNFSNNNKSKPSQHDNHADLKTMQINVRIAIWNANGLINHIREIETFIQLQHIDIFLISETHFTKKSYFKIKDYDIVSCNHPDERAHGGSAILIKSSLNYVPLENYRMPHLQAAGIEIESGNSSFSIYSIYIPPRHSVKCQDFNNFFDSLGNKFLVGGDFNAKHQWWGSRLANPKGKELYKTITNKNFTVLTTGSPTYWPSDPRKIPDLLDFVVYSGISSHLLDILGTDELSSDHSPLIVNFNTYCSTTDKKYKIISPKTDINFFKNWLEANINLNVRIKDGKELDDVVENFTNLIHEAGFKATPTATQENSRNKVIVSAEIRNLIREKRRLRKIWKRTRNPADKTNFNRATNDLKRRLEDNKNEQLRCYLENLTTSCDRRNKHNLWNATKYLKRPTKRNVPIKDQSGTWCRSNHNKAFSFSQYLENIFTPFALCEPEDTDITSAFLDIPCQMDLPIKHISPDEVNREISKLNNRKSPGYDKICANDIKNLPKKAIILLTTIYNSIVRLNHFPTQWKCAEIMMFHKPSKPENDIKSYRPISLLPIFSKIFEKLFLRRLQPVLNTKNIIPEHQFGFRHKHGTPEQCHRVVNVIRNALETKQYCSAVFLDVKQAFDRVWHVGLLYKLKMLIPAPFYLVLKSYLQNRYFYVKINDETSNICDIKAGIPQGSVLGPVLYTLYTSDMPSNENVTIATYADDTALMASNISAVEASNQVQNHLDSMANWSKRWNISINTEKSNYITFTLRRGISPPIFLNNEEIPKTDCVKYLGMHLDKRLTWKQHIKAKRDCLNIKTKRMHWLLGQKSKLSLENKVLLYTTILKPIWTYGIQLWGTASNSNIEILQRYQSKTLRMIVDAP